MSGTSIIAKFFMSVKEFLRSLGYQYNVGTLSWVSLALAPKCRAI